MTAPVDTATEEPTDTEEVPATQADRSRVRAAVVGMAVAALLAGGLIFVVNARNDAASARAEVVRVPADTAAGLRDGSAKDLVPSTIRLEPGQELVLENSDWRPHTLGSLAADRGATVRRTFDAEGRYVTTTSLRADGRVTILVESPPSN